MLSIYALPMIVTYLLGGVEGEAYALPMIVTYRLRGVEGEAYLLDPRK